MGVSKNRGTPKMDGLFHGKPYEQMDGIWAVFTHYFRKHPNAQSQKHAACV